MNRGFQEITVSFVINGNRATVKTASSSTLLEMIREKLHLTGAKEGCGKGECGACTVLVNGEPVNSCLMLAAQVEGKRVETIEGLARGEQLHPLQKAFVQEGAVQCGYCTPGMIMSAKALLDRKKNPTKQEIKQALSGNLCRCTGYTKIIKAVESAVANLSGN